jgi:hypothetical protein
VNRGAAGAWLQRPSVPPQAELGGRAPPGISVLIPSLADGPRLRRAIWSVHQTTDLPFQVVAAPAGHGVAANRNLCLSLAREELVAFVDDDVLLPLGWASRLAAVLLREPSVGAVSASLLFPDGRPQMRRHPLPAGVLWDTTPPGTCFAYSRARAGDARFDEGYLGSQWEDTDWMWTLARRELRTVVTGDVRAAHDHVAREHPWLEHNARRFCGRWGRLPAADEVATIGRAELAGSRPVPLDEWLAGPP